MEFTKEGYPILESRMEYPKVCTKDDIINKPVVDDDGTPVGVIVDAGLSSLKSKDKNMRAWQIRTELRKGPLVKLFQGMHGWSKKNKPKIKASVSKKETAATSTKTAKGEKQVTVKKAVKSKKVVKKKDEGLSKKWK